MSPVRRGSSEWHRPAAANRISTSPSLGGSSSSSMISQSLPMSLSTAALVFMRTSRVQPADHYPPRRPPRSMCPTPREEPQIHSSERPVLRATATPPAPPCPPASTRGPAARADDAPYLLFLARGHIDPNPVRRSPGQAPLPDRTAAPCLDRVGEARPSRAPT